MSSQPSAVNQAMSVNPQRVIARLEALLGLRYMQHQWSDLLRLLRPVADEMGFESVQACLLWIEYGAQDADAVNTLARHLTIGESYFFREIGVISVLRETLIPEILDRKVRGGERTLNIWSAGCSTGEEVYTLAMMVASMLEVDDPMRVRILGTDINSAALERARHGVYRDWSFRDMPSELVDTWFTEEMPGRYAVHPRLRDMVEFRQLNLVELASYPTGFDLILCRNVLMYFTRDVVGRIVQSFRRSLRDDGWLVPSMTEVTLVNAPGLESRRFGEVTLFTRQNRIATLLQFTRQEAAEQESSEDSHEHYHFRNPFASLLHLREDVDTTLSENATPADDTVPDTADSHGEAGTREFSPSHSAAAEQGDHERRLNSGDSESLLREALALADSGLLEQARTLAARAVELEKMKPEAHFVLATILREMGETTAAAASFDRALYLDHEMIVAHVAAAAVQRMLGRADRALRHIATARGLLLRLGGHDAAVPLSDLTAGALLDMLGTLETPHG